MGSEPHSQKVYTEKFNPSSGYKSNPSLSQQWPGVSLRFLLNMRDQDEEK